VKVQRPGALSTISKDLYVMRRGVGVYEQLVKRFTAQTTDYQQLVSTFAEGLYTEMDFRNEVSSVVEPVIGMVCAGLSRCTVHKESHSEEDRSEGQEGQEGCRAAESYSEGAARTEGSSQAATGRLSPFVKHCHA